MTDIHSCSYFCDRPECIKAQRDELRERLAQPEQPAQQEPVALVVDGVLVKSELPEKYTGHLYTAPPQRKPLTDEQKAVLRECRDQAMKWSAQGRIPECGVFSAIAQDLDWLCDQLAAHGIKEKA